MKGTGITMKANYNSKEAVWKTFKKATRVQLIITLLTLHRAFKMGNKRLKEFERAFEQTVLEVKEYATDDVIMEKLTDEFKSMGYDLNSLLHDYSDLTFADMQNQERRERKKTLAENAEIVKKLKAEGFYGKGE